MPTCSCHRCGHILLRALSGMTSLSSTLLFPTFPLCVSTAIFKPDRNLHCRSFIYMQQKKRRRRRVALHTASISSMLLSNRHSIARAASRAQDVERRRRCILALLCHFENLRTHRQAGANFAGHITATTACLLDEHHITACCIHLCRCNTPLRLPRLNRRHLYPAFLGFAYLTTAFLSRAHSATALPGGGTVG